MQFSMLKQVCLGNGETAAQDGMQTARQAKFGMLGSKMPISVMEQFFSIHV